MPKTVFKNSVVTFKWDFEPRNEFDNPTLFINCFNAKNDRFMGQAGRERAESKVFKWTVNVPEGAYYFTIDNIESNPFGVIRKDFTKVRTVTLDKHVFTCIP